MSILKDNQKKEKRYECGEVILYEPNKIQIQEIRDIILKNTKINLETGEAETSYSYEIIRYIFKFYTTIGEEVDELEDEELENLIENGNHKIQGLMRAITEMLREIAEQFLYETLQTIRNINTQLEASQLELEANNLKNKMVKNSPKNDTLINDIIENIKEKEKIKEKDIE